MKGDADVAAVAKLIGEPARVALLLALMEREPLPAKDLADRAGIAPSTASEHLAKLLAGGLVGAEKNGRHRYFRLAGASVADALEALAAIAPAREVHSLRDASAAEAIRTARTCYDHLAGGLGVALADALRRRQIIARRNGSLVLGRSARTGLRALGIELEALRQGRRPVLRACLDWSERRPHVAGALGAALAGRFLELGWIERRAANRSVAVTPAGRAGFRELGLRL